MTHPRVIQDLEQKIQAGLQSITGKTILHTAPHHDDILLGYFPYLVRNLASNTNHVLYITSGANGVSDRYLADSLSLTKQDVQAFDEATKQVLKFAIREAESEKKWALVAGDQVQINHLRANFYNAGGHESAVDLKKDDVQRIVAYLNAVKPDIITMLVEPAGIGPATHHCSQQVLTAAIVQWQQSLSQQHMQDLQIIGYRNVWSSFSLEETSMIVPVKQYELDQIESIFMQCFPTQTSMLIADDGMKNFAQESVRIQKAQLRQVVKLLGKPLDEFQAAIFLQKIIL